VRNSTVAQQEIPDSIPPGVCDTAAGKRLLDRSTTIGSDAMAERMAEVAKRTMNHCRQIMESREP
jgi:hypothetical protein